MDGSGNRGDMWVLTQAAPYNHGPAGVHRVLPQAERALVQLGTAAGLRPRVVPDAAALSPDHLSGPVVLALFTIGETPFSPEVRAAAERAFRAGSLKVLGVHSATDACHGWPGYLTLLGARFDGHPWTMEFTVSVVDRDHPATAHLPSEFRWTDELYLFATARPDLRVLLRAADGGHPLAWCTERDGSRSFYTALGHFPEAWEDPVYLRHLAGGLSWLTDGTIPPEGPAA